MDCKRKITFHSAAIAEDARLGYVAAHNDGPTKRSADGVHVPTTAASSIWATCAASRCRAGRAAVKQPTAGDFAPRRKTRSQEADRKAARADCTRIGRNVAPYRMANKNATVPAPQSNKCILFLDWCFLSC